MSLKDTYQKKMDDQYAAWQSTLESLQAKLETLKAKVEKLDPGSRAVYEKQIRELEGKINAARAKLEISQEEKQQVRAEGDQAWKDLKQEAATTWKGVKKGATQAWKEMKTSLEKPPKGK